MNTQALTAELTRHGLAASVLIAQVIEGRHIFWYKPGTFSSPGPIGLPYQANLEHNCELSRNIEFVRVVVLEIPGLQSRFP